jgi:hypothetical protein
MVAKKLTLFVCFLTCANLVFAQKIPLIGVEAGFTLAQSADKLNRTEYYAGYMNPGTTSQYSFITNPTLGLLIGITAEWKIRKNSNLISGLQFQNVNTRYHIIGTIPNILGKWNFEEWGKEKLYKMSIPVTLGYTFNTGRIKPSVNMGVSFNYYLLGKINQKINNSFFSFFDSQTTNWTSDETINPFKADEEYFDSAKRFVTQMIVRLSIDIGKNLSINAGCNIGLNNSCKNTYMYRGNYSISYSYKYTRIANSDLTVSISYNIFNPKSSDKLKSEEKE